MKIRIIIFLQIFLYNLCTSSIPEVYSLAHDLDERAAEIDRQFQKLDREREQDEENIRNAPTQEELQKANEAIEKMTAPKSGLDRGKQLREGTESLEEARKEKLKKSLNFYTSETASTFKSKESLFSIEGLKTKLLPKVAKWITGLLSALAVIFLMYAGIQYLTAGGEEEKITNATKTTFYVLIGVVLMMFAYAIVYLFLTILA